MHSSNQQLSGQPVLSANALSLLALSDAIMEEWVARTRQAVRSTASMAEPILINTLPVFLQNLAEAIAPDFPRILATANSSIAMAHGSERARMTDYRPADIAHEYQLFRESLFDVCEREGVALDRSERSTISTSIDSAVLESISAYAATQAAYRTNYIATLAHDLRTPLSVIQSALDMLAGPVVAAQLPMLLETMRRNVGRADQMLRELLDTAALQSGEHLRLQLGEVALLALVNEVVRDAPLHSGGYTVHGDPVTGYWCQASLRRALENLLRNAVKYGDPTTPVTITSSRLDNKVLLAIHNHGKPIAPGQIAEHFVIFRRGSDAGKVGGWGLGLAYVKNVAESHGGSINIDSSAETGTTITIDLPLRAITPQHP
jgi:signal transduction histidine kinase